MSYCNNCGTQVSDTAKFCENCGSAVNHYQQYGGQPQYNYQYPRYEYVRYVKPKTPGKGIAVASMVLGIIGLVYAFIFLIVTISEGADAGLAPAIFMISPLSILAICFANSATNRGYISGINKTGLITGIIGLIGYIVSFFGSFS